MRFLVSSRLMDYICAERKIKRNKHFTNVRALTKNKNCINNYGSLKISFYKKVDPRIDLIS